MDSSASPRAAYTQHNDALHALQPVQPDIHFSASGKPAKHSAVPFASTAHSDSLQRFSWYRSWHALRWQLARGVFARPLPFLTAHLDLKLGDVLLTVPFATALVVSCAVDLVNVQTKKSALPVQLAMALTFVLAVRNNSLLLALTGLSFERALFYHKLFGAIAFVTATMHGMSYLIKHHEVYGSAGVGRTFTPAEIADASSAAAATGTIAYVPLVLLTVLSLAVVRRHCYELFVRTHWILFVVIIIGSIIHRSEIILVGVALWAIDALYRRVYLARTYRYGSKWFCLNASDSSNNSNPQQQSTGVAAPSQVALVRVSHDVVRLEFPTVRADTGERFAYSAGQYVFVCVPRVASFEWHPFTISSAPHEATVTLHIKALGDWSSKLVQLTDASSDAAGGDAKSVDSTMSMPLELDVLLDGPYGSMSLDLASPTTYAHVALISDGIGVTPMRSIASQLFYERTSGCRNALQRVHFVWSVRDRELLHAVPLTPFAAAGATSDTAAVFTTEIFFPAVERDLEHPVVVNGNPALARSIRYGTRPDIAATLRALGVDAQQHKQTRVAVLVCGPAALTKDVVETSIRLSREMALHFDVHNEVFEY